MKESKLCLRCGKPFTNRKSWKLRGQWEQVIYCSERCKAGK